MSSDPQGGDAFDNKRIEELATGFALGELQEHELKELYDCLRADNSDDAAAITWQTLATTLDMKMKLSPHFADTIRHRIENDDGKSDDAFAGGILQRLGKRRKQLDPVATAQDAPRSLSALLILLPLCLIILLGWFLVPSNSSFPMVRHVSGGKVFQEGDSLSIDQRVDQRQIAIAKNALLTLEWPGGDQASIQGPATILVQNRGMSVVNGTVWLMVNPDFTIGLPDQHVRSKEKSRIGLNVEDSISVLGVDTGVLSYGRPDSGQEHELSDGKAIWNGEREFNWRYFEGGGITTNPVQLQLDPIAAYWTCSLTVSFSDDQAMLVCRGLDEKAEEMLLHIQPNAVSAHKDGLELWRYALSGAPRSPRRVTIEGRQGAATSLSISGLDKKIQWHLHAPLDALEMKGPVALKDLRYRTGPPPIPKHAFVKKE